MPQEVGGCGSLGRAGILPPLHVPSPTAMKDYTEIILYPEALGQSTVGAQGEGAAGAPPTCLCSLGVPPSRSASRKSGCKWGDLGKMNGGPLLGLNLSGLAHACQVGQERPLPEIQESSCGSEPLSWVEQLPPPQPSS